MDTNDLDLKARKTGARARAKNALAQLSEDDQKLLSSRIHGRIVDTEEWRVATHVLCFSSMPTEVDTALMIRSALASGKSVYLPRIGSAGMSFHLTDDNDLTLHPYGMLEPSADAPQLRLEESPGGSLLVICPGLQFDESGNRLGRGKAYYDRFLASIRTAAIPAVTAGICFEVQVAPVVPAGPLDHQMDLLVTESRVIRFK